MGYCACKAVSISLKFPKSVYDLCLKGRPNENIEKNDKTKLLCFDSPAGTCIGSIGVQERTISIRPG
jgi:hypothetical protein